MLRTLCLLLTLFPCLFSAIDQRTANLSTLIERSNVIAFARLSETGEKGGPGRARIEILELLRGEPPAKVIDASWACGLPDLCGTWTTPYTGIVFLNRDTATNGWTLSRVSAGPFFVDFFFRMDEFPEVAADRTLSARMRIFRAVRWAAEDDDRQNASLIYFVRSLRGVPYEHLEEFANGSQSRGTRRAACVSLTLDLLRGRPDAPLHALREYLAMRDTNDRAALHTAVMAFSGDEITDAATLVEEAIAAKAGTFTGALLRLLSQVHSKSTVGALVPLLDSPIRDYRRIALAALSSYALGLPPVQPFSNTSEQRIQAEIRAKREAARGNAGTFDPEMINWGGVFPPEREAELIKYWKEWWSRN